MIKFPSAIALALSIVSSSIGTPSFLTSPPAPTRKKGRKALDVEAIQAAQDKRERRRQRNLRQQKID